DVRFDDDIDVCVLASKLDGIWSAGADINLLASSTPDYKAMFCLNCQETLNKMESTPKLFIAAIDGHCVGGGLEIAMATDLRIASDGAWRGRLPEDTHGVLPGTGGTQRLPRLVGKSRAIDLKATGRMITPKEALDWGLFNRVCPRAKFWEEAMALARGWREDWKRFARQHIGRKDRLCLAAEGDGRVVGFLLGAILQRPKVFERRTYGHIYDVFVDAGLRNRGVGQALVTAAMGWFR